MKMKTINDLIKELSNLKSELKEKPVFIISENGQLFPPDIKFLLKDKMNFDKNKENVKSIILTI